MHKKYRRNADITQCFSLYIFLSVEKGIISLSPLIVKKKLQTAKGLYEAVKQRLSPEGKAYLFLDEIQEVEEWEKAVNSFMTDFNVDIYVTGSNSRIGFSTLNHQNNLTATSVSADKTVLYLFSGLSIFENFSLYGVVCLTFL